MRTIEPTEIGIVSSRIRQMQIKSINWDQFKGQVPENPRYYAHIYWNIDYKYNFTFKQQTDANNEIVRKYKIIVTAKPYITNKSWVRLDKSNDKLLEHEYGHYLIGCICALKFQQRVNQCGIEFGSRSQGIKYCQSQFQEILKKYLQVQIKYDQESNHYYNQIGQSKWNKWIVQEINSFSETKRLTRIESLMTNQRNIQPGRKYQSVDRKNRSRSGSRQKSKQKSGKQNNKSQETIESQNSRSQEKSRQLSTGKCNSIGSHQSNGRCCVGGHYNIRIRKTSMSYPPLPPRQPTN